MVFPLFLEYLKAVFLFAGKGLLVPMGWLTKILKGSSHKFSDGQINGRYREDRNLDNPRYSAVNASFFFICSWFFVHCHFEVEIKGFLGILISGWI